MVLGISTYKVFKQCLPHNRYSSTPIAGHSLSRLRYRRDSGHKPSCPDNIGTVGQSVKIAIFTYFVPMTFKVFTNKFWSDRPPIFLAMTLFMRERWTWAYGFFIAGLSAEVRCYARKYWFRILYVHAHYVIICNDQLIIGRRSWTKVSRVCCV